MKAFYGEKEVEVIDFQKMEDETYCKVIDDKGNVDEVLVDYIVIKERK